MNFVYILQNTQAKKVKVGMTVNKPEERLKVINQMWSRYRATCQVCGGRRLISIRDGLIPLHSASGPHHATKRNCNGSLKPPLERDTSIAEAYLNELNNLVIDSDGIKKNSITRMANNLEKRIEVYKHLELPVGKWQIKTVFHTNNAEPVESMAHEILDYCLDRKAPFGEVFCCSVEEAEEAVEKALKHLGIMDKSKKESFADVEQNSLGGNFEHNDVVRKPAKYECIMCKSQWEGLEPGINYCPECDEHLFAKFISYL